MHHCPSQLGRRSNTQSCSPPSGRAVCQLGGRRGPVGVRADGAQGDAGRCGRAALRHGLPHAGKRIPTPACTGGDREPARRHPAPTQAVCACRGVAALCRRLPACLSPSRPPLRTSLYTAPPQPEEGRYAIEDLSARLPVDLSEAEQTLGVFTQNCIVVAEGELREDGVFRVAALGQPPLEARAQSLQARRAGRGCRALAGHGEPRGCSVPMPADSGHTCCAVAEGPHEPRLAAKHPSRQARHAAHPPPPALSPTGPARAGPVWGRSPGGARVAGLGGAARWGPHRAAVRRVAGPARHPGPPAHRVCGWVGARTRDAWTAMAAGQLPQLVRAFRRMLCGGAGAGGAAARSNSLPLEQPCPPTRPRPHPHPLAILHAGWLCAVWPALPSHPNRQPQHRRGCRLQPAGAAALALCAHGALPVVRRHCHGRALPTLAGAFCSAGPRDQPVPCASSATAGRCAAGGVACRATAACCMRSRGLGRRKAVPACLAPCCPAVHLLPACPHCLAATACLLPSPLVCPIASRPAASLCWCRDRETWDRAAACLGRDCRRR